MKGVESKIFKKMSQREQKCRCCNQMFHFNVSDSKYIHTHTCIHVSVFRRQEQAKADLGLRELEKVFRGGGGVPPLILYLSSLSTESSAEPKT